ncbi:MAG: Diguanylate cyclase/phosphodiesterase with PAS/PAC sensor(S) [Rhodospirillaceae bacterium]|nr:MAG: Diguanylate cyclase/phosphodiesterase with PAS/PAC sensor(S) [Rhodospirillaceae bacterium]
MFPCKSRLFGWRGDKKMTNYSQEQICNDVVSLSDRTFRTLVEAAPEGMIVIDATGRVVVFNKAATGLLLYDPTMILGHPVTSLLADSTADTADLLGAVALEEGGIALSRHFVTCKRGDDTLVTLEVAATRLLHGDHRLFIALLRDVNNAFVTGSEEIEARLGSIVTNLPGIVFQRIQSQDGSLCYPFFSVGGCATFWAWNPKTCASPMTDVSTSFTGRIVTTTCGRCTVPQANYRRATKPSGPSPVPEK